MANNFHRLSDAQLAVVAQNSSTVISDNAAVYGVTVAQATGYSSASSSYDTEMNNAESIRAAYHSAVSAKNNTRTALLNQMSFIGNLLYNNPAVTEEMLLAAGYSPRDTSRTAVVPQTPTNLVATPYANGTAALKWSRNGNPSGVTFVIEWSDDGLTWSIVSTTTRRSILMPGYPAGVAAWFRVTAAHAGQSSFPTNPVQIYGVGQAVNLKAA